MSGMKDAIGQITTETSYSAGAAYTIQQTGFNVFGESLGETVTIPAASGDTGLSGSYTFAHTYTAGVSLPFDDKYPAGGGLPAETTGRTYLATPLDLASGLGGTIDGYAQSTTYDAYGDVTQEEIGTGSNLAYITSTYGGSSGGPNALTAAATTGGSTSASAFGYDAAGNMTSRTTPPPAPSP